MPTATLDAVVEALDDEALAPCWDDGMTLGWVYHYWNDPSREALDKKLNDGGKVEPHEIASKKTQMFTERYMVDWLLQNSLGPMWLAMSVAVLDPRQIEVRHGRSVALRHEVAQRPRVVLGLVRVAGNVAPVVSRLLQLPLVDPAR